MPDARVLDGTSLYFGDRVDNEMVKLLLFDFLSPENLRVDLMSSIFGRDTDIAAEEDDEEESDAEEEKKTDGDDYGAVPMDLAEDDDCGEIETVDTAAFGPPSVEPWFGTKFWTEPIGTGVLQGWKNASEPHPPTESIHLPPRNGYIPTEFDLKPLPADDASHPLLNCSVKVCVASGKKKSWYPAYVTKYSIGSNGSHRLSLSYEDEDEKEHVLDSPEDYAKFKEGQDSSVEVGLKGTLDGKKITFRVTAVPRDGADKTFSFGDSAHDDDVEDGLAFPAVPPPAGEGRLPRLVHDKSSVRLWHLQDRKFKRPIADLRVRVQCEGMAGSALNQACMSLFCKLCADALVETCYLASVSEIGSTLRATETGFYVRVNGFDHKLLELAKQVLSVAFSFKGRDGQTELPSTIKSGRFEACLEVQLRQYRNAGLDASSFSSSLRLMCLRPAVKSSFAKRRALEGITVAKFVEVMNALLGRLSVEALYHGNVTEEDAGHAAAIIMDALTPLHLGLPRKKLPSKLVVKARLSPDASALTVPSIDPKDSNTAVEVYFQFAKDDNSEEALRQRVLTDLLEALLDEPLYDQLRTKEQVRSGVGVDLHLTERFTQIPLIFIFPAVRI